MMAATQGKKSNEPQEVLIDGVLYDVSGFRHPGGSVIKFLVNAGDATDAFNEFHLRSKKAHLLLKSLPKRPAPKDVMMDRAYNQREELAQDYAKLRAEFKREGFFDPSPMEVTYRLSEIVAMHALGIYLFFQGGFFRVLGLVVLGIVQGRCGWLMHEGGHYSMTGNMTIDKGLQIVLYGVGCGMSAGWWRSQHNRHHATPQKLQHDVDLDTLPLMAFNQAVADRMKNPVGKAWLSLQGFLFIPVSCLLVALGWQFYLHPRYMIRSKKKWEFSTLVLRLVLIFGVMLRDFSWGEAIGYYLLYDFIGAAYIFTNFSLSHTHLPVSKPDEYLHWVEYASLHTINITPGFICNWWMGYLNFQIEHHLFPSAPQFRHPQMSPRVRALFEKHGLPYDVRDYFAALGDTLHNLHDVGTHTKAA